MNSQPNKQENIVTTRESAQGNLQILVPRLDKPTQKGVYAAGAILSSELKLLLDSFTPLFNVKARIWNREPYNFVTFTVGKPTKGKRSNVGKGEFKKDDVVFLSLFLNDLYGSDRWVSPDMDEVTRNSLKSLLDANAKVDVLLQETVSRGGVSYIRLIISKPKSSTPTPTPTPEVDPETLYTFKVPTATLEESSLEESSLGTFNGLKVSTATQEETLVPLPF